MRIRKQDVNIPIPIGIPALDCLNAPAGGYVRIRSSIAESPPRKSSKVCSRQIWTFWAGLAFGTTSKTNGVSVVVVTFIDFPFLQPNLLSGRLVVRHEF